MATALNLPQLLKLSFSAHIILCLEVQSRVELRRSQIDEQHIIRNTIDGIHKTHFSQYRQAQKHST